jgi:hypothetical protein
MNKQPDEVIPLSSAFLEIARLSRLETTPQWCDDCVNTTPHTCEDYGPLHEQYTCTKCGHLHWVQVR